VRNRQLWKRRPGTATLYENFSVKGLPRFHGSLETDEPETAQFRAEQRKAEAERRVRGLIDTTAAR
jgi:hypothetical protein